MLNIIDGPGRRPREEMRQHFECCRAQHGGARQQYITCANDCKWDFLAVHGDAETDAMWIGFALGMRGADQLSARATPPLQAIPEGDA